MPPFTEPFNSEPGSSEGWISRLATRRLAQRLQEQQAAERRRKRGVRLGRHHIQAGDHGLPPILAPVFNASTAFLLSEPELIAETFSIDVAYGCRQARPAPASG